MPQSRRALPILNPREIRLFEFQFKRSYGSDSCWTWKGYQGRGNYGGFSLRGDNWQAHRLAAALYQGPFDPALDVDHLCRNRLCVNPYHLEAKPPRDNNLAFGSRTVAAAHAAKPSCPKCGGPYTQKAGYRRCVACHRKTNRERSRALRAAAKSNTDPTPKEKKPHGD